MYELIKMLFRRRDRDLVVMIVDQKDTREPDEIRLNARNLGRWFQVAIYGGALFLVLFLVLLVLRWTAGGDARIRMELNELAERVGALSDSVEVRDQQLLQIRSTLSGGTRTGTEVPGRPTRAESSTLIESSTSGGDGTGTVGVVFPADWSRTTRSAVARPSIRGNLGVELAAATFPARIPVTGRITRSYMPEIRHYGTDIAVRDGTVLRNIAKGTAIGSDWTIPYGYVVSIIHEDGYVIVYKHLSASSVQSGDVLQKGDQIGIVGMAGTLSSGPHLHIELWKNGSHIDPMLYFIE